MGDYYHLQVLSGLTSDRSLLSCQAGGLVDLWSEDDGSGRQRWVVTQVPGEADDIYTIEVFGGTDPGKLYLNVPDENQVDLGPADDGSGRQRWQMIPLGEDIVSPAVPSYYEIHSQSGYGHFLSCDADGTVVDLYDYDDGSGRQRWQLQGPHTETNG